MKVQDYEVKFSVGLHYDIGIVHFCLRPLHGKYSASSEIKIAPARKFAIWRKY